MKAVLQRDHEHVRDPRQISRQIPGDPVGEILLFGIVAQIDKGQHDDRQARRGRRLRRQRVPPRLARRLTIFAHLADKAHALAVHGTNDTLRSAAVVDRLARRIKARRQCRVRNDPPAPNALDQIVLADDPPAVAHQIDEKVEHLRFERYRLGPAAQFASLDIEHVIAKPENHPRSPGSAQADVS